MDGRPHGKLLPRYAGPIAAFLLGHPDASRADLLDFIARTFEVRVSRIALYKFLKKYGLQDVAGPAQPAAQASAAVDTDTLGPLQSSSATTQAPGDAPVPEIPPAPLGLPAPATASAPLGLPAPATAQAPLSLPAPAAMAAPVFVPVTPPAPPFCPAPRFCSDGRNTPVPSC
jgi:hypothetical protein